MEEERVPRYYRFTNRIRRRNGVITTERVRERVPRRVLKPRDAVGKSKSCYDPMDPAILACLQVIRTGTGPTSGTIHPRSYFSARRAATTTGHQAQVEGEGAVPNKDLGNSSETLVKNLKLEDIQISN